MNWSKVAINFNIALLLTLDTQKFAEKKNNDELCNIVLLTVFLKKRVK